jgi:hypothetical protein
MRRNPMRQIDHTIHAMRLAVTLLLTILMLATPLIGLAQDAEPADPAPAPGALQVTLTGTTGLALSGTFAVTDSVGTYQQVAVSGGFGSVGNVAAGPATVTQLGGTTDFALDYAARYVEIPAGGTASVAFPNAFLDADGDGIGDSVDACPAGNDLLDSDGDGIADACDPTPFGDPTPVPTVIPTVEPTMIPTEMPTQAPTMEPTTEPTDATQVIAEDETAELLVEIADEPMIVDDAPVSCQEAAATSPWIASDLDDYPPGGLVTLTGGDWVPGQVVEIFVDDDGIADDEMGEWSHSATVVADEDGTLVYVFNIAPWFVADYTVVATGECSKAETAFTDSVQGGSCIQITPSDVVAPGSYVMFRCTALNNSNPIRVGVTSITAGWQWSFVFSNDQNLAPPAYSSLNWNTSGTASDSSASGAINTAYFFLSPLSSALPGSTGTVSVQIKNPNGTTVQYTSEITAHRAIQGTDVSITCTPSTQTIGVTSTGTVTCTVTAPTIAPEARVTATLTVPNLPEWNRTATPRTGTVTVARTGSQAVTFTLAPTCAAPTTARSMTVTSSLVLSNNFITQPPPVTGPSSSVSAARTSGTALTTRVTAASLDWSRPYAFTASTANPGSLTYAVDATGCSGWDVQVAASSFVSAQGRTIPASNLALTNSSTPVGPNLTRPATSGTLDSSRTVLAASSTDSTSSYTQTLGLNMTVPGGTLIGTYNSTITITAASGP